MIFGPETSLQTPGLAFNYFWHLTLAASLRSACDQPKIRSNHTVKLDHADEDQQGENRAHMNSEGNIRAQDR